MQLRDILQLPASSRLPSFDDTISAIDALHVFPQIGPFPLIWTNRRAEQGAYHYQEHPSRPISICISRSASHPHLTLVHEVGHFVDHLAANRIKRGFATDHDALFDPLLQLWASSKNVLRLNQLLRSFGTLESSSSRSHLRFHLAPRELWARTYAQWVAVRSENLTLQTELQKFRRIGSLFAGRWCTFQWEDEAFKPIMRAVDRLMEEVTK